MHVSMIWLYSKDKSESIRSKVHLSVRCKDALDCSSIGLALEYTSCQVQGCLYSVQCVLIAGGKVICKIRFKLLVASTMSSYSDHKALTLKILNWNTQAQSFQTQKEK